MLHWSKFEVGNIHYAYILWGALLFNALCVVVVSAAYIILKQQGI
jgi:hypothetical protein